MLPNALTLIRSLLFTIPLIIAVTVGVGIMDLIVSLVLSAPRRRDFRDRLSRQWVQVVLASSFVRVTARGLNKIDPAATYVFCCNHLSYMDPPIILACLGRRVRFLAKKSLFGIPLFGWTMRRIGHLPIERENPRAAARSLNTAADVIRSGASVVIFPEGGRSLDGKLQPFLSGGFRLALDAQVAVVPLAIVGTRAVLAPGSINIHGGCVRLIVGDPIFTQGMTAKDKDELATRVRQAIEQMLPEAPIDD